MNELPAITSTEPDPQAALDPLALGARIIDLRNSKGWTQRELARRAGLRPQRLSVLELGRKLPQLDEFVRLARALAVGLEALASGEAQRRQTHELLREVEALGTPEEVAGLARIFKLLLLGYQRATGAAS